MSAVLMQYQGSVLPTWISVHADTGVLAVNTHTVNQTQQYVFYVQVVISDDPEDQYLKKITMKVNVVDVVNENDITQEDVEDVPIG